MWQSYQGRNVMNWLILILWLWQVQNPWGLRYVPWYVGLWRLHGYVLDFKHLLAMDLAETFDTSSDPADNDVKC